MSYIMTRHMDLNGISHEKIISDKITIQHSYYS